MKRRTMFAGSDYDPVKDGARLTGQLLRVYNVMKDQGWRTLNVISQLTGDPEASISAQLRHLRKKKFGAHRVEKRNEGMGIFLYRVLPPLPTNEVQLEMQL